VLESTTALRYVTPLREGGSLPGIVEAEDFGTYVVKFRGAGQGPKVLVAEVIVGELARRLGIPVPELKTIEFDEAIGLREPDPEVQDLLVASAGLNLAVDFLPGSLGYDGSSFRPDADLAARILWLDALVANVDRTWRNPNLLVWHRRLWGDRPRCRPLLPPRLDHRGAVQPPALRRQRPHPPGICRRHRPRRRGACPDGHRRPAG
jgi:hypothetical protein